MMRILIFGLLGLVFVVFMLAFSTGYLQELPVVSELFRGMQKQILQPGTHGIANQSTWALVCAVNSVHQGSRWNPENCPYEGSGVTGQVFAQETGETTEAATVKCKSDFSECTVLGFHLPQEVQERGLIDPATWIKGWGDPEYIVYYEKFQEGQDSYWKADMLSMSYLPILIGAGVNALLGPGKGLTKEVKGELAEATAELGSKSAAKKYVRKQTLKKVFDASVFGGIARAVKRIKNIFKFVTGNTAERAARRTVFKEYLLGELGEDVPKLFKNNPDALDDLYTALLKNGHIGRNGALKGSRESIEATFKKQLGDNFEKYHLWTKQGTKNTGLVNRWSKSYTDAITGTGEFTTKKTPSLLRKSVSKVELNFMTKRTTYKRLFDNLAEGLDDNIIKTQIEAFENMPASELNKMLKNSDEFFEVYGKNLPTELEKLKNMKGVDSGIVKKLGSASYAAVRKVSGIDKASDILKTPLVVLEETRNNKLYLAVALSWFAHMSDSILEKTLPHGKDSLMLSISTWESQSFELEEDTFYLNLIKSEDDSQYRLHLVSPCKADITVKRKKSTCQIPKGELSKNSIVELEEGLIPVERTSIEYSEEAGFMGYKEYGRIMNSISVSDRWFLGSQVNADESRRGVYFKKTLGDLYSYDKNQKKLRKYMVREVQHEDEIIKTVYSVEREFNHVHVQAKAARLGTYTWYDWMDVGGEPGYKYAVIHYLDNYNLVRRKGNDYYNLKSSGMNKENWEKIKRIISYWNDEWEWVEEDIGPISEYMKDLFSKNTPERVTTGNEITDYYKHKIPYEYDAFDTRDGRPIFFSPHHFLDRTRYLSPKIHAIFHEKRKEDVKERVERIDNAVEKIIDYFNDKFDSVESDYQDCIATGNIDSCSDAVLVYGKYIGYLRNENTPYVIPGTGGDKLTPYIFNTTMLSLLKEAENRFLETRLKIGGRTKHNFDFLITAKEKCIQSITYENGEKFGNENNCKIFKSLFDSFLQSINLYDDSVKFFDLTDPENKSRYQHIYIEWERENEELPSQEIIDYYNQYTDINLEDTVLEERIGPLHTTANHTYWGYDQAGKYHDWYIYHYLAGDLRDLAEDVIAVHLYLEEPRKKTEQLGIFNKEFNDTLKLVSQCNHSVRENRDKPYKAENYKSCRDALVELKGLYYYTPPGLTSTETEELKQQVELAFNRVLSYAQNIEELFKIMQRYKPDDPGSGCRSYPSTYSLFDIMSGRIPPINVKTGKCLIGSYEELREYNMQEDKENDDDNAYEDWPTAYTASLYWSKDGLFETTGILSPLPRQFSEGLFAKITDYAAYTTAEYEHTKSSVMVCQLDNVYPEGCRKKNNMIHFWTPVDIAAYNEYRRQDCSNVAETVKQIPALNQIYGGWVEVETDELLLNPEWVDAAFAATSMYNFPYLMPAVPPKIEEKTRDLLTPDFIEEGISDFKQYLKEKKKKITIYKELDDMGDAEIMGSKFIRECTSSLGGLYPFYFEEKMIPHYSSERPYITGIHGFDRYVIPEFRRMENDDYVYDDDYFELLFKKRYIESKDYMLDTVDAESGMFADFRRKEGFTKEDYRVPQITADEFQKWVSINVQLSNRFGDFIDKSNAVKKCESQTGIWLKKPFWETNVPYSKIDSLDVTVSFDGYGDYNSGYNYCYGAPISKGMRALEIMVWGIAMFGDPIVAAGTAYLTGGTCLSVCTRIALAAKGALEEVALQKIKQITSWPKHPGITSGTAYEAKGLDDISAAP